MPTKSRSGRYWYNLHLVLVVQGRYAITDLDLLRRVYDTSRRVAAQNRYFISELSVLPDHLHVALRGAIDQSTGEIALEFLNGLAHGVRQGAIWKHGYYIGTFSEYSMNAVRRRLAGNLAHLPREVAGGGA